MQDGWLRYVWEHNLPDAEPPNPYLCPVCCGELDWDGHCIYCESEDSDEADTDEQAPIR